MQVRSLYLLEPHPPNRIGLDVVFERVAIVGESSAINSAGNFTGPTMIRQRDSSWLTASI